MPYFVIFCFTTNVFCYVLFYSVSIKGEKMEWNNMLYFTFTSAFEQLECQ